MLHAKQFHDTKGCFQKWSKIKKLTFTKKLYGGNHGLMLGLSMTARKQAFENERKETGELPNMSVYGVCFSSVLSRVVVETQIGKSPPCGNTARQRASPWLLPAFRARIRGIKHKLGKVAVDALTRRSGAV